MLNYFPKTKNYLDQLSFDIADPLDIKAGQLIKDENAYERASQALRRRFSRGADIVEGIDRGDRLTQVKRVGKLGNYRYSVRGADNSWNKPEERIWVVAMYALWQDSNKA